MKKAAYNYWLWIASVIFLIGILMDFGVYQTGIYCFVVTESFMDYVFAAIVSIALISFSIIALISGLLQNRFYGYRLSEILSFKTSGKRINLKKYVIVSLVYIIVAATLLAMNFKMSCVNSLFMLMVSAAFSAGCIACFVFDVMLNEKTVCNSLKENYEVMITDDTEKSELNYHINTITNAMLEAVAQENLEEKEDLCKLLAVLLKAVTEEERDWTQITYFENCLKKCSLKISERFGYHEMLKDVDLIFGAYKDWEYLKPNIYRVPLQELLFYGDKELTEHDYSAQVLEVDLLEDYKTGKITPLDWQKIMHQYLKAISENTVCTVQMKKKIINQYLLKLTNLYSAKNGELLTQEECALLNVLKYQVLTNEADETNRKYIFERLVRNLAMNNVNRRSDDYYLFLSIFFEAFYAYAYKELDVRTREYRDSIKKIFQLEISDSMVSRLKATKILEFNIEWVLSAFKNRIPQDVVEAQNFEDSTDFMSAKTVGMVAGI